MSVAKKVDRFEHQAEERKHSQECEPTSYMPTKQALAEADRVLNIKKSKQRKFPADLMERLKSPLPVENNALAGR